MSKQIIQSLWIGERLTTIEKLALNSFLRCGHEFHLYTYEDIEGIPNGVVIKDGNEILPGGEIFYQTRGAGKGSVAAFADLFRYKLIHDLGGCWVDTDFICLRPLTFDHEYVFSSEFAGDGKTVKINNGVIVAPKKSPIMAYCLEKSNAINKNSIGWGDIGPKLMQEAISKFGYTKYVEPPQRFCPVAHHALAYMLVVDRSLFDLEGALLLHLWNEQWRRLKIDKNSAFPSNTLIEFFKEKYL